VSDADRQGALFEESTAREPRAFSVTSLHNAIKKLLANELRRVTVTGEARDIKTRGSTTYLKLRERSSQIDVQFGVSRARWCHVRHGETVAVTGTVSTSSNMSLVHIAAESIVPVGAGAIAQLHDEVRERLRRDGLFDRPRRPKPLLPATVAVVCGDDAAVRHDFQVIANQRFPNYPIVFVTASQSSAESIMDGLRRAQLVSNVELVVLARGGGDANQLLPYSDEYLCRAIAASPIPIVTAIGHEQDRPICDDIADERAPTPTAAAISVIPQRSELIAQLSRSAQQRRQHVSTRLHELHMQHRAIGEVLSDVPQQRIERAAQELVRRTPRHTLDLRLERDRLRLHQCDPLARRHAHLERAERALAQRVVRVPDVSHLRYRVTTSGERLTAASPQRLLERGLAVVTRSDGGIVRSVQDVRPGDEMMVRVSDGTLRVVVDHVAPSVSEDSAT
jgi:exodeoxyribonuclease VII large subunit